MAKTSSFSQRLRTVLDLKGITQSELSRLSGIGKSSISRYVKGDWEGKQDAVYTLANALNVSEAWLMGYEVPMERADTEKRIDPEPNIYTIPGVLPVPPMVQKPMIGTIACGTPILAEQNIESVVAVPEDIRCDFALRCQGDSMINIHITDGAIVYVREQPDVENGEIAAVIIEDSATLKRVYKTESTLTLMPENSKYPPLVFSEEEMNRVRILGLVVAWTNFLLPREG